jgi:hypothetical protein
LRVGDHLIDRLGVREEARKNIAVRVRASGTEVLA